MQILNFITVVLLSIIVIYTLYYGILWGMGRYAAKAIKQEDLIAAGRKGQLIDVREAAEFEARHILGARNIPSSQFKMRFKEIRKDQAVYLVDEAFGTAQRAAFRLKRNGYQDIYILKGGMSEWTGKVKTAKGK